MVKVSNIDRSDFLRISGKAACAMMITGTVISGLSSCASVRVFKTAAGADGKAVMPLSEFAVEKMRILRIEKLAYDVLVIRKNENDFDALVMRCSHQDWNLSPNARGLSCSLHGSTFDLEGRVVNGPASAPLQKLKVIRQDEQLIIF